MSILKKMFNYVILGLILILLVNLSRDIWRLWHADEKIEDARQKLEEEKQKNKEIKEKKAAQDELFLEEQIRDKLGMAKPDEIVVILPEKLTVTKDKEEQKNRQELSNWQQWLNLLSRGDFAKIGE